MLNMKTGTPVRVFRQGSGTPPTCTYEGLYKVIGHRMEKSSDGPKVGPAGEACWHHGRAEHARRRTPHVLHE